MKDILVITRRYAGETFEAEFARRGSAAKLLKSTTHRT